MKRVILFCTLLLVQAVGVTTQLFTVMTDRPQAHDFQLPDMDDHIHQLTDYRGKPLIINFWATWCLPCRVEIPSMNRAYKKLKREGIEIIAINAGEEKSAISAFLQDYPINFTVLRDPSGNLFKKWFIKGLPTTFIIDSKGRIVYQVIGPREWDSEAMLDRLRSVK